MLSSIVPAKLVRYLLSMAIIVSAAACSVGDDIKVEPAESDVAQDQYQRLSDQSLVIEDEPSGGTRDELLAGYCPGCANCVYRARCLQPRLPTGLTSWSDKLNRVNSHRPRVGCVAMIYTGSAYGHVAYVADRHADGTITIKEGNWVGDTCSSRRRSTTRCSPMSATSTSTATSMRPRA